MTLYMKDKGGDTIAIVEEDVEGVRVKIGPFSGLKKGRILCIASFPCPCGLTDVKIEEKHIKTPDPASRRFPGFRAVKNAVQFAKEWNSIPEDFCGYIRGMTLIKEKWRLAGDRMDGYDATISIDCSVCGRRHRVPLRLENPIKRKPEILPLEALKTLEIKDNRLTKVALSKAGLRNGFQDWQSYRQHLIDLIGDQGAIPAQLEEIAKNIEEIRDSALTEYGRDFITRVTLQLTDSARDFKQAIDKRLSAHIVDIQSELRVIP